MAMIDMRADCTWHYAYNVGHSNAAMKNFNLDAILEAMLKMSDRVSDLNFSVGAQPQVKSDGALVPVNFPGLPRLTPYQTESIAMHLPRCDRDLTRPPVPNGPGRWSYSI